jgi:NADPH-dependent ferric siderophore reductase
MARPTYSLFRVTAQHVELVTPHMKRVTIDGSCLSAFRAGLPARWLKVFVPGGEGQAITGRGCTAGAADKLRPAV